MPNAKYPWDDWFSVLRKRGGKVTLLKGEDYNCMTHCMYIQFWAMARKRKVGISCQVRKGGQALEIRGRK